MNRLILVGNGFDLAHGLKTSYKDFIIGHLVESFFRVDHWKFDYNDELLSVRVVHPINFKEFVRKSVKEPSKALLIEKKEIQSFFELLDQNSLLWDLFNLGNAEFITGKHIVDGKAQFLEYTSKILSIKINCNFYKRIITSCFDCGWVDIENEYFDCLKACREKDGLFDKEQVRRLNREFSYLKQKLEEYLTIQQKEANIKAIPDLLEAIRSKFEISDFEPLMGYENTRVSLGLIRMGPKVKHHLYFLNFNYTNVLKEYYNDLVKRQTEFSKIEINYIHGKLNEPDNPIIFGFGDEYDKEYVEFEEHRNNELFEHIKSYQYLRTPNYRNLLNYLNSGEYQVFVMGHSCGLSDRTMFKEIFEHENCKSVRLFHYNGDFHDKAINVSKHFSNKGHMRKLIVDYKESDAFPQNKKN